MDRDILIIMIVAFVLIFNIWMLHTIVELCNAVYRVDYEYNPHATSPRPRDGMYEIVCEPSESNLFVVGVSSGDHRSVLILNP